MALVVAERGPFGARLVAVDETGDRQFIAVREPGDAQLVRDTHPTISPDGTWIVFASSRGRGSLAETSLWIAPLGVEQPARRLTRDAIDAHPQWASDGSYLVYASAAPGGRFDLMRLAMRDGRAVGDPVRLTSAPGNEVTPSIATDGTIVYTSVSAADGATVDSHLEQRAPDGTITRITDGPADSAPAISPDGKLLAFARPGIANGRTSTELWLLPHGATEPTAVVGLPLTDEGGPVWSRDGRFLFATSVMVGEAGVLFSSVIHVDITEPVRHARMLVDRAGAVARLTPAMGTPVLDARVLKEDPEYLSELARIMARALEKRAVEAEEAPP